MIKGRVWKFGDDIDTDQIYPGKYLPLTDKQEMARHAMEGTNRGDEFISSVKNGDIIVAGSNFGCGSSREHAPVAIKGIGVSVVIAESFARIFHRNCVNTGLPILVLPETERVRDGDIIEVDVVKGTIKNETTTEELQAVTLSKLELQIMRAGGLLAYLKSAH
ncbi:3-isopropylmalate dehydratase [candidate division WOR_3 bacterium SM23_42]|uniref:3-isopropylmalate dehydratase small subunit n=1 Tax=candidate division WOR_3 bacterium SM23_42 TaxID=1703779 RepID=A0A0S8FTD7_UNCW3|nr:MAG: 3-isopropylmalate dehydratase [candidate division WOR_3 bacterium SM23_42]